jgi:hypothetical protein
MSDIYNYFNGSDEDYKMYDEVKYWLDFSFLSDSETVNTGESLKSIVMDNHANGDFIDGILASCNEEMECYEKLTNPNYFKLYLKYADEYDRRFNTKHPEEFTCYPIRKVRRTGISFDAELQNIRLSKTWHTHTLFDSLYSPTYCSKYQSDVLLHNNFFFYGLYQRIRMCRHCDIVSLFYPKKTQFYPQIFRSLDRSSFIEKEIVVQYWHSHAYRAAYSKYADEIKTLFKDLMIDEMTIGERQYIDNVTLSYYNKINEYILEKTEYINEFNTFKAGIELKYGYENSHEEKINYLFDITGITFLVSIYDFLTLNMQECLFSILGGIIDVFYDWTNYDENERYHGKLSQKNYFVYLVVRKICDIIDTLSCLIPTSYYNHLQSNILRSHEDYGDKYGEYNLKSNFSETRDAINRVYRHDFECFTNFVRSDSIKKLFKIFEYTISSEEYHGLSNYDINKLYIPHVLKWQVMDDFKEYVDTIISDDVELVKTKYMNKLRNVPCHVSQNLKHIETDRALNNISFTFIDDLNTLFDRRKFVAGDDTMNMMVDSCYETYFDIKLQDFALPSDTKIITEEEINQLSENGKKFLFRVLTSCQGNSPKIIFQLRYFRDMLLHHNETDIEILNDEFMTRFFGHELDNRENFRGLVYSLGKNYNESYETDWKEIRKEPHYKVASPQEFLDFIVGSIYNMSYRNFKAFVINSNERIDEGFDDMDKEIILPDNNRDELTIGDLIDRLGNFMQDNPSFEPMDPRITKLTFKQTIFNEKLS